jgi:hypothetical protein
VSYNGSGTFNINSAGQPVVTGTVITSTAFNALTSDLATGLTTAITKDGQTTPTANIPMGGFKITGLAAGTLTTDAVRLSQLQSVGTTTYITAAGTDTITGTVTPTLAAYATGQQFSFVVAATNTAAVTLNINSLGAKAVTRTGSVALVAGDMVIGQVVIVEYDGTRFQLINGNSFTNLKVSGTLGVTGVATFAAGTVALPSITTTGDTNTGVYFPAADTVGITAGGAEAMRIDSTGHLGIGLTSYNLPLSVVADSNGQNVQLNGRTGDSLVQMFFRNFGGTNNLASISSDSGNTLQFGTGSQTAPTVPTERMRIDSSGNVLVGKASATANGGDVQVSSGITFPATQVPKSDANTLDDYEEGTWTPVLRFGTLSVGITYTTQTGNYTKIGNMVYFNMFIVLSSKGSSTGAADIAGLPETVGVTSSASIRGNTFAAALDAVPNALSIAGGATIRIENLPNGSSTVANLTDTNFAATTSLLISGSYRV